MRNILSNSIKRNKILWQPCKSSCITNMKTWFYLLSLAYIYNYNNPPVLFPRTQSITKCTEIILQSRQMLILCLSGHIPRLKMMVNSSTPNTWTDIYGFRTKFHLKLLKQPHKIVYTLKFNKIINQIISNCS